MTDPVAADIAPLAVLRGEPDAYNMGKTRLMGRQAAGYGFLRAAVAARQGRPIHGYTPSEQRAKEFIGIVKEIDPSAPVTWIPTDHLARVGQVGVAYLADITVSTHARLRLRDGVAAFSLCGVTHTTASSSSMDEVVGLLREPVMPWDAVVCTTNAVLESIRRVHEAEREYLRWRFGADLRLELPQLPIIPLGVHCADFEISPEARAAARAELGLTPETVTALFVGRLVFHAKAHPVAMYQGLQAAAERTGAPIALIMCGWSPNDSVARAFANGAELFAPDVKVIFVEGRDAVKRDLAWSSADLFVSLSDNIQETFGLTPIEAMAAGLPVVVTDWDGYRDTVRHNVDGFRVATWSPAPGMGVPIARGFEHGGLDYDRYCWVAAATTAVDLVELGEVISRLVVNPDLRRQMGEAGRKRAREVFDWHVVFRQYQGLWAELNARREAAKANPDIAARIAAAPRMGASRQDPFHVFGHYPTSHITGGTTITLTPGAGLATLQAALSQGMFTQLPSTTAQLNAILTLAEPGPLTVATAAERLGATVPVTARSAGVLAKIGVIRLG